MTDPHATSAPPIDDDLPPSAARYRDLRQVVKDSRDKRNAARGHLYALEIPTSVIVGVVLGKAADTWFAIAPWGLTVGLVAGVGAAVRSIVRLIAWQKALDADEPAQDNDPPGDGGDPGSPGSPREPGQRHGGGA